MQTIEDDINNGGPIARIGLDYQDSIAIFVCILNFENDSFEIFLENKDDFEVVLDGTNTFIQVKGKVLSKDEELRKILKKNLSKNRDGFECRYKVVCYDFKDIHKKNLSKGSSLVFGKKDVYKYSQEQQKEINITNIDKAYLFFFSNENMRQKLLGYMAEKNILIDSNQGNIALNELEKQVKNKSILKIDNITDLYDDKKKINRELLITIFKTSKQAQKRKEILNDLPFDQFEKHKIESEFNRLLVNHQALRQNVLKIIEGFELKDYKELVKELFDRCNNIIVSDSEKYAVLIDIIADKVCEDLDI